MKTILIIFILLTILFSKEDINCSDRNLSNKQTAVYQIDVKDKVDNILYMPENKIHLKVILFI